jgi:hypothetical protein
MIVQDGCKRGKDNRRRDSPIKRRDSPIKRRNEDYDLVPIESRIDSPK